MALTFITGWILIFLGAILGAGGAWLAVLGGSWAYGVAGIALVACGTLLLRRRRIALGVYAALLVAMAAWSLWEVGLDRWALVPRGALLAVVGLWLLAAWIDQTLGEAGNVGAPARSSWRGARGWLAGAMLSVAVLAAISITRDPFDVAGLLPDALVSQTAAQGLTGPPAAAGEDWPAYGGTGQGQRYSSLADITPATVSRLGLAWTFAWTFHTGETPRPGDPVERTFEVTPLKVGDLLYLCSARQHAIALDAATGQVRWRFDPHIDVGHTSQHLTQLRLVYLGLGNRSPDQLGAGRSAEVERFSSAIIALEVATGKLRWVFRTVRHDLWDRDVPAQASLIDLTIDGKVVQALVMPTKQGDLYVLDRRSGQPILPVHERPVPPSTVPGEFAAPTQPYSSLSHMPPALVGKDMWRATPLDQLICRIKLRRLAYDGPYTPPSTRRTLVYPGNLGVFNWGGVAVDPVRQIMVGTPAFLAFTFQLIPRPDATANVVSAGASEYWNENLGAAYAVKIGPFLSPLGLPCQAPPWGSIAGVDLRTGQRAWMHRHGTVRDQMPGVLPIPFPMGVASLGGPLITAGGVMFYSGTLDNYLRAYDVTTGRKLWESRLPAGGQATPMTYRIHGRQMVVVAAGGHGSFGTTLGDTVLAYELK